MGKISFTTDMWSSDNRNSYMAVTAHWIARDEKTTSLSLKIALIAFRYVACEHTGEHLGKILLGILDDAEIPVEKVSLTRRLSLD